MHLFVLLVAAVALFAALAYLKRLLYLKRWDHFPGPKAITSLPLLGHGYKFGAKPLECLTAHQTEFGPIFRLDFGPFPTVWLCEYDDYAEAFKKDILTDRPHHLMPAMGLSRGVDSRGFLSGPIFANGLAWSEQRKFMFQQMSNLGMGKTDTMEEVICQEATILCERFKRESDGGKSPIGVNNNFMTAVNNIVWRILTGKRSKQTDPLMKELTKNVWDFFRVLERGTILNQVQMNSAIVTKISQLIGLENMVDICQPTIKMIQQECNESEPDNEGNYMERFKDRISSASSSSTFHGQDGELHMIGSVFDVFAAGTDTMSTFLEWSIHYMVCYPDVQEKCREEIDRVIGADRPPKLSDRSDTPYVEATIQEMMRHSPHMALTLSHLLTEDMEFRGFHFPKGTQVYGYHGAVHYSKKTFGKDAEYFRPERFLDGQGNFKLHEHILYFGTGNRRCVGEILGRAGQFLFFVALIQNFRMKPEPGKGKPEFQYLPGLNQHPTLFKVLFEPRF